MEKLDLEKSRVYSHTKDDIIAAMSLVGQEVYMSDCVNFDVYYKRILAGVQFIENDSAPFLGGVNERGKEAYNYFILAKDAKFVGEKKEKKLRPYNDITEFWYETGCDAIGRDTITVRNKVTKQESVLLYIGYSNDMVHLGGCQITFKALLEFYEFYESYDLYDSNYDGGEWLPFGIEVNE